MGSDPTDVHPEHDQLRPGNIEDWTEEQIAEYKRRKEGDLQEGADERRAELSQKQRETLGKLRSAVDETDATETVQFGDAELVVQAKLTGEIERKFDRIMDAQDSGRLAEVSDAMISVITSLVIADNEPDSDPVDYQDAAVWQAFHEEGGIEELGQAFETVCTPAIERVDDLKFRGTNGGRDNRGATR